MARTYGGIFQPGHDTTAADSTFMKEYGLSLDELAEVYRKLPDFCRNDEFDRVLEDGSFEEAV